MGQVLLIRIVKLDQNGLLPYPLLHACPDSVQRAQTGGTANFGLAWGAHGTAPDEARHIFGASADAGGNFIDTANGCQEGQSEEFVGELMTGRRNEFILVTRFTVKTSVHSGILVTGNSRWAMVSFVEQGLRHCQWSKARHPHAIVTDTVAIASSRRTP